MMELKLLIVEDDPEAITAYERDISSFNLGSPVKISQTIISDKNNAIEILKGKDISFDAAIVDLKLDTMDNPDEEYSGNEVLRIIKGNIRFPVFVITGTPQHIAEDLKDESSFFKIKVRGEEDNHLEQLVSIYNTGITKILGKSGQIEGYLSTIFWKHLAISMDSWISDTSRSAEQKEKSLLRYTLLHMQEYIDEEIEKYHPNEFYISAPIKKNIFTGDVLIYENNRFIVLTPSCDIVLRGDGTRNTTMILLCQIEPLSIAISNFNLLGADTGDNNENKKKLNRFIENNGKQNFHFIPKTNVIEAGLINFQKKRTIPESDINKLIEDGVVVRIATISAPFLKDIISRYSNYYSRQGAPDFNTSEIYSSLFK